MTPDQYRNIVGPLDDDIEANPPDAVILARGSDLKPVPVAWLWRHWLALKKLHILAGAPGQGKTTIAIAMAATVTMGGRWPDGTRCEAGNVLIWSGEDDPADTLLPRLLAAEGDAKRCYFVQGSRRAGEVVPFDPARDLAQLRQAIDEIGGISLLIVDPVVSAVTGDSHKNGEVRRALQPLVDLADACSCAVLGITHFSKGGQGGDPSQRVVGSVAFTAVARVVMVAAKVKGDEEGQDARILARSKSNIGPDDGGFQYHLDQCEPLPGIPASRIAWGKAVDGTARELLTDPDEEACETPSEKGELAMLMWAELKEGPTPSKTVESALVGMGYSKKQIRTTREKMFIKPQKSGMGAGWYWSLPDGFQPKPEWRQAVGEHEDALEDAQGAQLSKLGILGTFGASSEDKANLLSQDAHPAQSPKHEHVEQHEQVAVTGTEV
ncbi:MAG: AAA family ATPase [Xanthomonadaceae bacterium]|nr:AAA family ATPase [Xanthomonadaceae bacterium]